MDEDRAISSVLGVVLILAVMTGAITAMMVVGTVALSQTQADTQLSQMETSMAEMSSKVSQVALGDSSSQSFDLGRQAIGNMHIDEEAGHVTVKVNGTTEYSDNLGVITYENGDSTVAFQGGGVWKSQNDNGGEMISPPEFHYQDATLTFPVIRSTAGETSASSSGTVIEREGDSVFPNEEYANPLDDQNATVEITSEYHRGWYEFFNSRTTGDVEYYPDEERVVVDLLAPFSNEIISGVAVTSDGSGFGGQADADIEGDQDLQSSDSLIQSKLADCEDSKEEVVSTTFKNETYCYDDDIVIGDEETEFDTTDNDISIVVDGGVNINQDETTVTGSNNVYIYQTDDLEFTAESTVDTTPPSESVSTFQDEDADDFTFILNSTVNEMRLENDKAGYGAVYGPESTLNMSAHSDFYGAVAVKNGDTPSTVRVKQDEDLDSYPIELGENFDIINYLHITENIVEFVFD